MQRLWWFDADRCRSLRAERGLNRNGAARLAGLRPKHLANLERGGTNPETYQPWPTSVVAVAAALGVPVEKLVAGDSDAFRADLARLGKAAA